MATFYNQATLTYNGTSTTSNITTGELLNVLSVTKTALTDEYTANGNVTYIINIVNTGTVSFSDITVSDDLGAYTLNQQTRTPLSFVTDSIRYFIKGVLQPATSISAGPPLRLTGISIPAGGNAVIVYETTVNQYAPLAEDDSIVNIATVSGDSITTPITASETVTAGADPTLTISKSLSPLTVTENGQLTYTFVIENTGNTAADASVNAVITDTFNPILDNISVVFNGTNWSSPTQYTYNTATGLFQTVAGQLTVPAATYTQDPTTGVWSVTPGVSTLTVTGTV